MSKHEHYFKSVAGLERIDVYRLLELFEVTCPVSQHIVKKALAAGKRGAKDCARDMQDIADSARRWLEMREEDRRRDFTLSPEGIYSEEYGRRGFSPWPGSDFPDSGPVEVLMRDGQTQLLGDVSSVDARFFEGVDPIGWRHVHVVAPEVMSARPACWDAAPDHADWLMRFAIPDGPDYFAWAKSEGFGYRNAVTGALLLGEWHPIESRRIDAPKNLASACQDAKQSANLCASTDSQRT